MCSSDLSVTVLLKSICDGGTPVQITMIASDYVEVAIHLDDSRGALVAPFKVLSVYIKS